MKKLYALLITAMFIASAVPVFAQGVDVSVQAQADAETERDYQDPAMRDERRQQRKGEAADRVLEGRARAATKARVQAEAIEHTKERLPAVKARAGARASNKAFALRAKEDFKQYRKAAFRARDVANARAQSALKLAAQAQVRAGDAKNRFREHRAKLRERKDELAQCKSDDSDACVELRTEARLNAITALESAALSAISELEKVKARIEASEDLTEEEATRLSASVEAQIEVVAKAQEQINRLSQESAKAEIKAATQNLRTALREVKVDAKAAAGKLVHAKVGRVVVRARHLQDQLNKVLDRAENAGLDVSVVADLVAEFDSQLKVAQQAHIATGAAFRAGDSEQAREQMQSAMQALREAHATLKEIFHELKEQKLEAELEAVIEAEAEQGAEPVYVEQESKAKIEGDLESFDEDDREYENADEGVDDASESEESDEESDDGSGVEAQA